MRLTCPQLLGESATASLAELNEKNLVDYIKAEAAHTMHEQGQPTWPWRLSGRLLHPPQERRLQAGAEARSTTSGLPAQGGARAALPRRPPWPSLNRRMRSSFAYAARHQLEWYSTKLHPAPCNQIKIKQHTHKHRVRDRRSSEFC